MRLEFLEPKAYLRCNELSLFHSGQGGGGGVCGLSIFGKADLEFGGKHFKLTEDSA